MQERTEEAEGGSQTWEDQMRGNRLAQEQILPEGFEDDFEGDNPDEEAAMYDNDSRSYGAVSSNDAASSNMDLPATVSNIRDDDFSIVGSTIANFLNQTDSPQSHEGGLIRPRAPLILETVRQMIERSNR